MKPNLLYLGAGKLVLRTKTFEEGGNDEDLKSSSEKEKGTRSKSVKNMQLRKTKEANQDLGAFKEGYLCNLRILTVKQLAIDSQLNQSKRRIGFIPKGVML